ncbi:hypothetical protein GCM10009565_89980 [Amycolatopsis albidoflavus]
MAGRNQAAQYLVGGDARLLKTYRGLLRRLDVLERGVRAHLETYRVSQGKNKLKAPRVAEDRRLGLHALACSLIKSFENLPAQVWKRDELLVRAQECRKKLNESQIALPSLNSVSPARLHPGSDLNAERISGPSHGEGSLPQSDRQSSRSADGRRAGKGRRLYIRIVGGGLPTLGRR